MCAMILKMLLVVGAVVLALLAVGSGAMIALSGDGEKVSDTPSPTTEPPSTSAPPGPWHRQPAETRRLSAKGFAIGGAAM